MTPNRFLAVVDQDKCKGCTVCLKRCKFEAIEMKMDPKTKKSKAYVDPAKCKGCGLCVLDCKPSALRVEIVRPPEYIKGRSTSVSDPKAPPKALPNFGFYELR
jgi:heterodisulfide reductase subunit A-like polyferredoxin